MTVALHAGNRVFFTLNNDIVHIMKYYILIYLVVITTLIVFYDHLSRAIFAFIGAEPSVLLGIYNIAVCIIIFLFAGGYVEKLIKKVEQYKVVRQDEKRKEKVTRTENMIRETIRNNTTKHK